MRKAYTRVRQGRVHELARVDGDEPIALRHSFALGLPVAVIRDRAMHEDYRRAAPLLHVPDRRAVDRYFLERGLIERPLLQRSMSGDQDGGSDNQSNDLHSVLLYSTRSEAAALRCLTTELKRAISRRRRIDSKSPARRHVKVDGPEFEALRRTLIPGDVNVSLTAVDKCLPGGVNPPGAR